MKRLIALTLLLLLTVAAFAQQGMGPGPGVKSYAGGGGSSLDTGLVSFWKLGEATGATRNDSVSTNHLTDNTSAVFQVVPGMIGNGAGLGGQTSWLKIADNASFSLTSSLTIVAWVRRGPTPSIDFPGVAGKWGTGDQRSYGLAFDRTGALAGTANRYYFQVNPSGLSAATVRAVANTFGTPATGTWFFLMGFFDDANNLIGVSVDDGAVDTTAFTGSVFDGTADFEIGRMGTSGNVFEGDIDAVGIWSRKLTTTEITCLYNSGTGQEPPFASCP